MLIESEDQYQKALKRVSELFNVEAGTKDYEELQELVTEIKIYEHTYYPEGKTEEPTYEFWIAKAGAIQSPDDANDSRNFTIEKVKLSDLTQQQIEILAGEFILNFDKLPPASKRIVRKKLQY